MEKPAAVGGAMSADSLTENIQVENIEGKCGQNISSHDHHQEESGRYLRKQRVLTRIDKDHRF